jgi:hypothetical protein
MFNLDYHTEAKLEFGGAYPALTDDKFLHVANACEKTRVIITGRSCSW